MDLGGLMPFWLGDHMISMNDRREKFFSQA